MEIAKRILFFLQSLLEFLLVLFDYINVGVIFIKRAFKFIVFHLLLYRVDMLLELIHSLRGLEIREATLVTQHHQGGSLEL